MDQRINALCEYLNGARSVYHAAAGIACQLEKAGYTRLEEAKAWDVVPGGKYYVVRGGTAVIAFRIPEGSPKGFLLSASHSDRPSFRLH